MTDKIDYASLQLGDVVTFKTHGQHAKLYPHIKWTEVGGDEWVIGHFFSSTSPRHWGYDEIALYRHVFGRDSYESVFLSMQQLDRLVRKGSGEFIPGITLPHCPASQRQFEYNRWQAILDNTPVPKHEGFCNVATWMAALTIDQSSSALSQVHSLRRKDGSINPEKARKLFESLRQPLESWVHQWHIELPAKFSRHSFRGRERLTVNWLEVAEHLAAKV